LRRRSRSGENVSGGISNGGWRIADESAERGVLRPDKIKKHNQEVF